jgi:hypothetical protein
MSEDFGVRIGTPEDVHPMMELALQACEENGFVDPNPQKLLAEIWPALNLDHGLVGIIQDEGDQLEGAILLRVNPMWYSDAMVLEERAIFIHPNYRSAKGGRARRLCEFSKKTADTLEIPLMIGVLSNHRTEAKVRLYERQFGKPSGAFFLYNARTGAFRAAAE